MIILSILLILSNMGQDYQDFQDKQDRSAIDEEINTDRSIYLSSVRH